MELNDNELKKVSGGDGNGAKEWTIFCDRCEYSASFDTRAEADQAVEMHKMQTNHQEFRYHQYVPGLF